MNEQKTKQKQKKPTNSGKKKKTKLEEVSDKVIVLDKTIKEVGQVVFGNQERSEKNLAKVQLMDKNILDHQVNWNRLEQSFSTMIERLNKIEIDLEELKSKEIDEVEEDN